MMVNPPIPARRRRLALFVRVAVSCILVGLLASRIDWQLTLASLAQVRWELCAAAWLLYLTSQVTSARRWSGLARPLGFEFPFLHYLRLYFEGSFFGLCLPGSIGGDVVKAYRLGQDTPSRLLAGCSVLADRLSGLSALLVLAASGALAREFQLSWPAALAVGGICSAVAIGAIQLSTWVAARFRRQSLAADNDRWARLAVYATRQQLLTNSFGWSLVVQGLNVATVWTLSKALGLEVPVVALFIAVPLVALAATIPITLQGIGIREGGLALLLASSGVTTEQGATLGLFWFLVAAASGLLGGFVYLSRRRESLSDTTVRPSSPLHAVASPPVRAQGSLP